MGFRSGTNYYFSFTDGNGGSDRLPIGSGTYSGPSVSDDTTPIRIAVVNPDTYRILKMGALNDSGNFYSIASGSIADGEDFTDPADWTGVGEQQDFISTILTHISHFEAV
jgi:hypothetical protein